MSCRGTIKSGTMMVKPMLSLNRCEAHTRVLGLYRAFYRYIPYILKYFDIPKNQNDVREKIKELFKKNAHVEDIRIIDTLVIKGYMELKEITHQWQQKGHIMANWCPSQDPVPRDFIGKFLQGIER
ncbi:NADH dehydrogenase [ubiquinone] 1 alpha subcomplex subunit 6-like [Pectinophora gossypiella]|uniref:NADH dehydrogenase [ubiquinone] 1 alpha subcomplex subunit 6-like n=1 Tax=Pectinophora gossypiella TaxID=13191 RepID=UPI00214F3566|nr:NADH dehydrogenase [ubiquinone] 1 alpha subcomplex subunit 6-like [Pectinophora gossypiella]